MFKFQNLIRSKTIFHNIICMPLHKGTGGPVSSTRSKHYSSITSSHFLLPLQIESQFRSNVPSSHPILRRSIHVSKISNKDVRYNEYLKKLKEGVKTVDVRNPGEIRSMGNVRGSFEIPLDQLKQEFSLPPSEWKEKYRSTKPIFETPIMLICASGVRSRAGVKILQQLGYKELMSYRGGYKMFKDKK